GFLGWAPMERTEVVDIKVAASLAGKEQRRAVAVFYPVERIDRPRLERDRSHARLCLRELQLGSGEGPAHIDDALGQVDVSFLECEPFRRAQSRRAHSRSPPGPRRVSSIACPCCTIAGIHSFQE